MDISEILLVSFTDRIHVNKAWEKINYSCNRANREQIHGFRDQFRQTFSLVRWSERLGNQSSEMIESYNTFWTIVFRHFTSLYLYALCTQCDSTSSYNFVAIDSWDDSKMSRLNNNWTKGVQNGKSGWTNQDEGRMLKSILISFKSCILLNTVRLYHN